MGWALLSLTTQDVIQLQQLPLFVSPFDDTGRICNDDECFLQSLLKLWLIILSVYTYHHWITALELFRYLASPGGGKPLYKPLCLQLKCCLYKHWASCTHWCFRWCFDSAHCTFPWEERIRAVFLPRCSLLDSLFFFKFGLFLRKGIRLHGRNGCSNKVQFFCQEHSGFAWAWCRASSAPLPGPFLLQLAILLLDGLWPESLSM